MLKKTTLLARQPIYDVKLNIIGYELLYRPESPQTALDVVTEGDKATSEVLLNAFTEVGMNNLIGTKKGFVNYTRNHILTPPPFQDCDLVIEVLEDIEPDQEVIQALMKLKQEGYTIALDDFIFNESLRPFVKIADIVKVDVLALDRKAVIEHVNLLSAFDVQLLAEKIEDRQMYDFCKSLGFNFFQGFFLSKPNIVKGHKIPANKMVVMDLIIKLQNPDLSMDDIHDTIAKDPALSYKVLRMINSAAWRRPNKIESLKSAIVLIGLNQIRRWGTFLALSSFADKPAALHEQTMIRAKMCEFLGAHINEKMADQYFTLGMLSMLDAFFDLPIDQLLDSISLSDEMNAALLQHEGQLGFILNAAILHEKGRFQEIAWDQAEQYGISADAIQQAYLDALSWSSEAEDGLMDSLP